MEDGHEGQDLEAASSYFCGDPDVPVTITEELIVSAHSYDEQGERPRGAEAGKRDMFTQN